MRVPLFVALALGGWASAQAPPGSVQVSFLSGRFYGGTLATGSNRYYDQTAVLTDTGTKGFSLGTQLTDRWGLEVSVRRSDNAPIAVADPDSATLQHAPAKLEFATIDLMGLRRFPMGRFQPYCALGAGTANLNINAPDPGWLDTNRLSLAGGAGAWYWVASWVALRLDLRARFTYLEKRWDGQDQGPLDPGRWLRTSEAMAGVAFSY